MPQGRFLCGYIFIYVCINNRKQKDCVDRELVKFRVDHTASVDLPEVRINLHLKHYFSHELCLSCKTGISVVLHRTCAKRACSKQS